MKDKIICLVGASGSGKTTIAKELEKRGYNIIHSYTTRKPRYENEWGHTFIDAYLSNDNTCIKTDQKTFYPEEMIAYKELYGEYYFATKEQYQDKGTSIYVVDPGGAEQVKENVKDANVITIYLQADHERRENRLLRSRDDVDALYDRLYDDCAIFSSVKCDYEVDANKTIDKVLESVLEVLSNR